MTLLIGYRHSIGYGPSTDGFVFTPAAAQSPLVDVLVSLLPIFIIAAGVGIFVAKIGRFPYTIALLIAGFGVSVATSGLEHTILSEIRLSHDLILFVLLPPLLFEGAATTELERLRRNLWPVLTLAVVGLILSVAILGIIGRVAFGFSLLVSLLFAAIILPTDPVSVLALFEELGAPERLSVLVEGESLLNDGVGVVLFTAFMMYVGGTTPTGELFTVVGLVQMAADVAIVSLGGILVGFVTGYAVYSVMINLDEHMTEIVLTFILVYGSFLVADYLHVSGVIATVVAGLFIGNRGAEYAMSPQTKISVFNSLETVAFLVNTFLFIMIGVTTPLNQLVKYASLIAIAIPLVLAVRAFTVYVLTSFVNRMTDPEISHSYQHVIVWGGLHASIPIALVLGLHEPSPLPVEKLQAMVFGVAAFSLVVQGLSMKSFLDYLDIGTFSEGEKLYELLVGRARAVDRALDAAERLNQGGDIPSSVYDDFTTEYEREKEELNEAISELLQEQPELRYEQRLSGERRVLQWEKSALMDARRRGVISDTISERLLEEVDLKLERVREGDSTLGGDDEGYEEFWRSRATAYGLFDDEEKAKADDD